MTPQYDQDTVEAARLGDRAAFDDIIDEHVSAVWRLVWRILRQPQDAAEVVRETFLAAHRALPAYGGDVPFPVWLYRIAVSRAVKLLERASDLRRPVLSGSPLAPEVTLGSLDPAEQARRIAQCRTRLPAGLRAVLVLHDAEGMPWELVEDVLGVPGVAARQRLWRARIAIWRCITNRGEASLPERPADEIFSSFVDGDLSPADAAAVQKRIETDPQVRAMYEELKILRTLTGKDDEPPPPADLIERIRVELPAGEAVPHRKVKRRPPPTAPTAPGSRTSGELVENREYPVGRIVIGLAVLAFLVAAVFMLVETEYGARLWDGLMARFGRTAQAAQAASPQQPGPEASAPAGSTGEVSGEATATPVPETSGPGSATPRESARPPMDTTLEAPTGTPAAPGPGAPETSERAGPPERQPAVPPETARTEELLPEAPAGTVVHTFCGATWRAPAPPLRWASAPPPNPARPLGALAEKIDGRGLLEPGTPPRVLMIVPRGRWADLMNGLRAEGVTVPELTPPETVPCASVVVLAPGS